MLLEDEAKTLKEDPYILELLKDPEAKNISEIKNCRKIVGAENTYRIRMGKYRIVFIIVVINNTAFFKLPLTRGDAHKSL